VVYSVEKQQVCKTDGEFLNIM